ncbi:MAG TPA: type II toxin-antitoxin system RelE/ParE family toxin [Kofleriaceae bacterium]|nr:type II toxin-antitoxin system RelE/ParE family toxin [Kofleriaceae bacterium]
MSHRLIIPPAVEQEIAEIYESFDSAELALAFIHDLDLLFERIVERPLQFPVLHTTMRRALLRHHGYSVFFELDTGRGRTIIQTVIHQRRDPARWPR